MTMRSIRQLCLLVITLCSVSVTPAQTVLDFEDADIPTNTIIDAQYGLRGVLFEHASLEQDPAAHSGMRVLRSIRTGTEYFGPPLPFVMTFTSAQARVKFFAGSQGVSLNGTLTAFDSSGNVVATDGPRFVTQNTFTTAFQVTVATPSITRVEFQLENTAFESIDDLEFEGEPPPTPPPAPVVTITQPIDGINVDIPGDIPKLDIAGTVTGEGLLSRVTVTVAFKRPPESATLPPLTLELDLTGTGTTRQFSLPDGMNGVPLGPITVTATAQNVGGLKGSATSTITNLPLAVRNRFITEGGAAVFGEFQYGIIGACSIAVYEHGAICGISGGAIVIRGDIFTKWLSLRGPFNETGWFGCPCSKNPETLECQPNEEGDTIGAARSQSFERGRIYAHLPGVAPPGAFYVPAVFTDAIDKRGGDEGIGLPLADPTDSAGVMQTWLFQRFSRPDNPNCLSTPCCTSGPDDPGCLSHLDDPDCLLPSTMEIRGSPPMLWMERQAGTWLQGPGILSGTFVRSPFDKARCKSPATLWESFPCADNLGPCTVHSEPDFPPSNLPDAGIQFCGGDTYFPGSNDPPEWKTSPAGDFVALPVFGAVLDAHMADIDNGFTHETHNANCPFLGVGLAIGAVLQPPPIAFGEYVAAQEYGLTCVSDFEFFVRPIGPITKPAGVASLFGKSNVDRIKTEYEIAYAAAAHNFLGAPATGDLVHMTGRWIIDCGHDTFKSELHPLFSFARMKTVISETNTFTGLEDDLFGGKPVTRVAIWVNGWYPGGDNNAIEFDAFPPPRPSPNSILHVNKPVDSDAAQDVTVEFNFRPAGAASQVHLRFSSPFRQNPVTSLGEMKFLPGREYWGIWYLYWDE